MSRRARFVGRAGQGSSLGRGRLERFSRSLPILPLLMANTINAWWCRSKPSSNSSRVIVRPQLKRPEGCSWARPSGSGSSVARPRPTSWRGLWSAGTRQAGRHERPRSERGRSDWRLRVIPRRIPRFPSAGTRLHGLPGPTEAGPLLMPADQSSSHDRKVKRPELGEVSTFRKEAEFGRRCN